MEDITVGRETLSISCVNTLYRNNQFTILDSNDQKAVNQYFQPKFRYVKDRVIHHEIAVDEEEFQQFRTFCTCDGLCLDSNMCSCRYLTRESNCFNVKFLMHNVFLFSLSHFFKS